MKKFKLILILALLFQARHASAEIKTETNEKTGKTEITSFFLQTGPFDKVIFSRIKDTPTCTIILQIKEKQKITFDSAQILFTGKLYYLHFRGTSYEIIDKENTLSSVSIDASEMATNIIQRPNAKLTLTTQEKGDLVWNIPDYIFDEWRQVIKWY